MLTDDAARHWFEWRLSGLLPGEVRTQLLRACLERGGAASAAWEDFLQLAGNPKRYFENAADGLKGLLPFVELGLNRNGIDPGREFATYLRVAVVREELRDDIYRSAFRATLELLHPLIRPPIVLRGLALADTCYAVASRRHNHGMELLIHPQDLQTASRALSESGIEYVAESPVAGLVRHRHCSGLPVTLHTRLFELPHLAQPMTTVRARCRTIELQGARVRVLDPADHLLHVCGHAAYSASRTNLRWICDAVLLARQEAHLDWDTIVCNAVRTGLALPLALMLDYLGSRFTLPLADPVLPQLRARCELDETRVRRVLHAVALECPSAAAAPPAPARLPPAALLRFHGFRILPTTDYVRWKYQVDGLAPTSWAYLRRIVGYLRHRISRLRKQAVAP